MTMTDDADRRKELARYFNKWTAYTKSAEYAAREAALRERQKGGEALPDQEIADVLGLPVEIVTDLMERGEEETKARFFRNDSSAKH
jgi:hypothetical protein